MCINSDCINEKNEQKHYIEIPKPYSRELEGEGLLEEDGCVGLGAFSWVTSLGSRFFFFKKKKFLTLTKTVSF
jgi:hypothetical protein